MFGRRVLQMCVRKTLRSVSEMAEVQQLNFVRAILTESLSSQSARDKFSELNRSKDLGLTDLTIDEIGSVFGTDTKALESFCEKLVAKVEVDQNNMTFPDFLILMSQRSCPKGTGNFHPVRDLFKSYDLEENGVINADEMKEWMDTHGKFITEVQAQALIDKMDQKHDGVIDYNEFLLVVARKILTSKLNLD